jgi:glycosyltransferase involved in cell wall biosynthesis
MLSVIIASRKEKYLQKTIDNVLENAEGEIEIIAVIDELLDGQVIKEDPRVKVILHNSPIGQRQSINEGARIAQGKYIMKLDAHCAVDKGFDIKLAKDCEYNWTVIPRMYCLDIETWLPKMHKRIDYMYISSKEDRTAESKDDRSNEGKPFRAQYYRHQPKNDIMIDDIMCCMGPGFFMHKDRFWELGGCDEGHGGWGQQGIEVSLKAWLSGGALKVNKNTWFAHWFRPGVGFPYQISGKDQIRAREYSQDLWFNNKWDKQVRDIYWLARKFNPPTWDIFEILTGKHKGETCYIVGTGPSISNLKESDFLPDIPIITISSAILKVESLNINNPIYSIQKNVVLHRPKRATLLVAKQGENPNEFKDYKPRYVFDTVKLFDGKNPFGYKEFSTNCALKMAKTMGFEKVKMLCFDAFTNGNLEAGYTDGVNKDLSGYKRQVPRIKALIEQEKLNVEWL